MRTPAAHRGPTSGPLADLMASAHCRRGEVPGANAAAVAEDSEADARGQVQCYVEYTLYSLALVRSVASHSLLRRVCVAAEDRNGLASAAEGGGQRQGRQGNFKS
jgi:hypothetical protein